MEEEQDLVYREGDARESPPGSPVRGSSRSGDWTLSLPADPTTLFRFSALTYNSHRIHYDHTYATEQEGFPGLVVHGPLLALLCLELPRRLDVTRRVTAFSYRISQPAFVGRSITATADPSTGTVEAGSDGHGPSVSGVLTLENR